MASLQIATRGKMQTLKEDSTTMYKSVPSSDLSAGYGGGLDLTRQGNLQHFGRQQHMN